ncbi:hypothetical protein [uncultured Clostridium sp.]|uniref:hypothetical protein n=1 Tax=uncultured Clostridium sp. TaxID=59620 RepID=UPI002586D972|nr:hypothetical protein [uncultured Clostridium sp.]MDU1348257.1 hypothetical protein [Clostridium argentinense]
MENEKYIYLSGFELAGDGKYRVFSEHYYPFHEEYGLGMTKEELEEEGILVTEMPKKESIKGKFAILYCNPESKDVWYEYEDIPEQPKEELQEEVKDLKEQLLEIQNYIVEQKYNNLLENGGM